MASDHVDQRSSEANSGEQGGHALEESCDRRAALVTGSSLLMTGGLVAGYGTFFAMAGRYLFPSGSGKAWMFVADVAGIEPGTSIPFESPSGVRVMITRQKSLADGATEADSFLALSSVCPHLGCRVQWEPHNNRYFCPCHSGVFDPSGKATGGPPAADGQSLSKYSLKVVDGALYIEMPYRSV
jgi:Rieske Fe-S protein